MAVVLHVAAVFALFAAASRHAALTRAQRRWAWATPALLLLLALLVTGDSFVILKWVPRLLMPLGVLWLALMALACVCLVRGRRRIGGALVLLSLFLWLSSCNILAVTLLARLESGYQLPAKGRRLDALLLLGGGTMDAPHGPQVSGHGDRVVMAARLYQRGVAALIVVGGAGVAALEPDGQARDLGDQTRTILLELGVPSDTILLDSGARNTREEIATFAGLVHERGWREVGLLTSAWHLPRAMRHAQRAGLEVTPVPSDFQGADTPGWNIVELLPSAHGAYRIKLVAWELLGILSMR